MHWAVFSPSLLSYPFSANYVQDDAHAEAINALLLQLDRQSSHVEAHFNSLGKMPMGKYFEQLLFFILERDERYEVVANNLPVRKGKDTIGEIDLMLRNVRTHQLEHWEIALKYYLQSQPSDDHSVMLGPNAIDNLAKKMSKLTQHQLPLTTDLSPFGISDTESVVDRLFIKGQFFYKLGYKDGCNIFPSAANPMHEKGWWCFLSSMDMIPDQNLLWTTILKPDWIGIQTLESINNSFDFNELKDSLKQHFQQEIHSVLCVGMQEENGLWKEVSRGFVVNNDWPHGSKKN